MLTDGHGVPRSVAIDGAHRHALNRPRRTLEGPVIERPEPTAQRPQGLCLDKGDDSEEVCELLREFGFTAHIRPRGEAAQDLREDASKKARRWVVERTPSWMNRFRRLLVRGDKKPAHYVACLHFAWGLIAFRAAGLVG